MSNLILRSIKDRGEKIFARIRDQIRNDRLRSLCIFIGIIIVVIGSYLIWLNFFHFKGMGVGEKQENPSQISQVLNTEENFLARISTGISRAFADMFGLSNENVIAEFPIEKRGVRERQNIKDNAFVFIDKDSAYPGGKIVKSGSGFTLSGEVIIFSSSPSGENKSVAVFADQSGQFNYSYTIQPSAEIGVYQYWAEDKTTKFVTDRIRYLIVSVAQKDIAPEKVAEILADAVKEDNKEIPSLILPKECSFSGTGATTSTKQIVINEVAWMGSDCPNRRECTSNEWIELKNVSSSEIDISGWWIIDQGEQIKVVFPQNTIISAGRFFLLERTDNDSVPNVRADIIYQGILSNDEEGLRLLSPDCLIRDEVLADPKWPAGEARSRKTMERKADLSGWQTSVFVNGTPKQRNSSGKVIFSERNATTENAIAATNINRVSESEILNSTTTESAGIRGNQANTPASSTLCSQDNLSTPLKTVLLNEIAWMGDSVSSSNEWIELYNPGTTTVLLAGWQLLDKAKDVDIVFDSVDSIPAGGYFLVLRSREKINFISGIQANKFYTGAINDSDETLRLFNNNCVLVDEVVAISNWIAGERDSDKTMERKVNLSGWQTSALAGGTPQQKNSSGEVVLSEDNSMAASTTPPPESMPSQPLKILISEIRLLPIPQRFIELYNPNNIDINLTGWDIQRRTATGAGFGFFVSEVNFKNRIIPAKSFLIIARENISQADIILPELALTNSNAIQLRNDSNTIVDKVGWGNALSFQGTNPAPNPSHQQSIQRRIINGVFVNTNNNIEDFELQNCPSPKSYFGNCSAMGQE